MEPIQDLVANKPFKDLNSLSFGHHKCPPAHAHHYNNLESYLIHYVVSGWGVYTEGKEYKVSPGEIFIIKKVHLADIWQIVITRGIISG